MKNKREKLSLKRIKYNIYLKSDHWRSIKARIKKEHRRCHTCGSVFKLSIHHLTYENLGNEKEEDLMVLCQECHKKLHENKIYHQKSFWKPWIDFLNNYKMTLSDNPQKINLVKEDKKIIDKILRGVNEQKYNPKLMKRAEKKLKKYIYTQEEFNRNIGGRSEFEYFSILYMLGKRAQDFRKAYEFSLVMNFNEQTENQKNRSEIWITEIKKKLSIPTGGLNEGNRRITEKSLCLKPDAIPTANRNYRMKSELSI